MEVVNTLELMLLERERAGVQPLDWMELDWVGGFIHLNAKNVMVLVVDVFLQSDIGICISFLHEH